MKGCWRRTAAFLAFSSALARAGWHGISGFLFLSRTNTRCIQLPQVSTEVGNVRLVNVMERFDGNDTGLTPLNLFNRYPQSPELAKVTRGCLCILS